MKYEVVSDRRSAGNNMIGLSVLEEELNKLEGNEYTEGGVSFYIVLERLNITTEENETVRQYLRQLTLTGKAEYNNIEFCKLTLLEQGIDNLKKLFIEWHLEKDSVERIISDLKTKHVSIYQFGQDYQYITQGTVSEIFRWICVDNEWYVLDFYIVD